MAKKIVIAAIFLLCSSFAFAGGVFYSDQELELSVPFEPSYDYNKVLVTYVIDGDTLKLENGEKVRLVGIDTPESKQNAKLKRDLKKTDKDAVTLINMGKKASRFTNSLASKKYVRLEFDVEKRDRYNRLLAYVYLPDGRMLNAEIIKAGYAQILSIPPNVKYQDLFLELQQEARDNNRGLWKE
ncbi:MAG: thermonuclease family protein [Candidatus Omnitrophica bacterium]|nr:thermonuclease family protein [Candidatus Omnitrophota bacterium]MBU4488449.1 thermonuclease family protein [Candidatus Omnitrophota bacterium]MCG2705645.1 thermonuclease family protein [Candidatus Omnitrophota bacterium]